MALADIVISREKSVSAPAGATQAALAAGPHHTGLPPLTPLAQFTSPSDPLWRPTVMRADFGGDFEGEVFTYPVGGSGAAVGPTAVGPAPLPLYREYEAALAEALSSELTAAEAGGAAGGLGVVGRWWVGGGWVVGGWWVGWG